jgi:hypothetical protein
MKAIMAWTGGRAPPGQNTPTKWSAPIKVALPAWSAFADQIADDHQPGGDADARLELEGLDIELTHGINDA